MTHDTSTRFDLALDLINSYDPYFDEPEKLATVDDLARFLDEHGYTAAAELTAADLDEVREVRTRLWEAFLARHEPAGPELLADLMRGALATPEVGPAYELNWRIVEVTASDATGLAGLAPARLAVHLGAAAALGLATALEEHGPDRLKSCAAAPCREVFLDTLRNRSRRFCGPGCANRFHVAAYRERG